MLLVQATTLTHVKGSAPFNAIPYEKLLPIFAFSTSYCGLKSYFMVWIIEFSTQRLPEQNTAFMFFIIAQTEAVKQAYFGLFPALHYETKTFLFRVQAATFDSSENLSAPLQVASAIFS